MRTFLASTITKAQAVAAAKEHPLAKVGRPKKKSTSVTVRFSADDRKGSDATISTGRGTEYLLRRLARDNPMVLKQYERGEFPSVRQAAIAAGIVKTNTLVERITALLGNAVMRSAGRKENAALLSSMRRWPNGLG